MLIGITFFMTLLNHPSPMCICLVVFCLLLSFYMKSIMVNMYLYFLMIIFVGGILLLLFYLTMISSNKPSWQSLIYLIIFILPEFYMIFNLKFNYNGLYMEMFNFKMLMILLIMILFLILIIMNVMIFKINFMRQL